MLQVQLLGTFSVASDRRGACATLGANSRRLAAYLFSFPNRAHRREKLIDLFWPEADAMQGRAAFSTALWRLRRLVATEPRARLALQADTREIRLALGEPALVDAHRFQAAVAAAFAAGCTADFEALGRAADLYGGPFLEEYDEDWVLDQRERLQSLYIRALAQLMQWLARQGRHEDALQFGRRILASDPLRESVQRAVMLLYVLNGQRGEAIRQFERCQRALRNECDVDPMPETRALHASIKSGDVFARLPQLADAAFAATADQSAL